MKAFAACLMLALLFPATHEAYAVTRYVDLNSPSPAPPYTSWSTAATNIQDAIEAAATGDLILVTNGIYQTGGVTTGTLLLTNRIAVTKPIVVQSVNGPQWTWVQGYQVPGTTNGNSAVRCAYLTNGSSLIGFTLAGGGTRAVSAETEGGGGGVYCVSTNAAISNCVIMANAAGYGGGGVYSGTLTDCVISNNSALTGRSWGGGAWNSTLNRCNLAHNVAAQSGGGAFLCAVDRCQIWNNSAPDGGGINDGTVNNSLLVGNSASQRGGGSSFAQLSNCTVISNTATTSAGGCFSSVGAMQNCIVYFNNAPTSPNMSAKYNYCCTTPNPFDVVNSFTNEPLFVDAAKGDFRLQFNSPCINAGGNGYVIGNFDLDGDARIASGAVDVGAYELQSPASQISYAWLQKYGFATDVSADSADPDGDGMGNWGEWRSDTIPTNALSALRLVNATNSPTGAKVTWQSVNTRFYFLTRATNLGLASPFQTIATNIVGVTGTKTYTDTSATNGGPYFYRVGVQ